MYSRSIKGYAKLTIKIPVLTIELPFDYTVFEVSGKVGIPYTGLTTPVWWLSLPQLTVLSRSILNHCVIEVFGGVFVLSHCF